MSSKLTLGIVSLSFATVAFTTNSHAVAAVCALAGFLALMFLVGRFADEASERRRQRDMTALQKSQRYGENH